MQRKIISQGNNSFTVTLPVKWIRENELNEGDLIEVDQDDSILKITSVQQKRKKEISLEFDEKNEQTLTMLLGQLYRQGYDVIRLHSKDPNTIQIISSITEKLFFEMEVIEKTKNECRLEMISEPSSDNYTAIMKKMLFMILDSMDTIHVSVSTGKLKDVGRIEEITQKYRQYDNFCRRYVMKNLKGTEQSDMVSLFIHLLMIQTDLRRLAKTAKKGVDYKLLETSAQLYKKTYEAFLKKDLDKLYVMNQKIRDLINLKLKKNIDVFQHHCVEILRIMYSTIVPMMGLSIKI